MKIAWITTGFPADEDDRSGAGFLKEHAEQLGAHTELTVFSLYYPARKPEYKFHNARVFSLGRPDGVASSKMEKLKVWRECKKKFIEVHLKEKFDVIHSMWAGESGYVASGLSKKLRIPLVVNICGGELAELKNIGYGSRLKFWQKRFVDISFKNASRVVYGSDYIYNRIKDCFSSEILEKTLKIPFGVDEKAFFPAKKNKFDRSKPVLVCVSSAAPVKSHADMFKALGLVRQKFPSVRLVVYGRDTENVLKNMMNDAGLSTNVELKGFIDHRLLPEALNNADVFVLSSLYESQNMSLLEAAFCGLPVVSTDAGVAGEVTPHIVKPGDFRSLAGRLIQVIDNYEAENKSAALLVTGCVKEFSLSVSAERFLLLYKDMIKKDSVP